MGSDIFHNLLAKANLPIPFYSLAKASGNSIIPYLIICWIELPPALAG